MRRRPRLSAQIAIEIGRTAVYTVREQYSGVNANVYLERSWRFGAVVRGVVPSGRKATPTAIIPLQEMPDTPSQDIAVLRGRVEAIARENLVRVFGVADLEKAQKAVPSLFERVGAAYRRAIVMGIPVNPAAMEGIVDRPTPLYFHTYRQLNYQLDTVALAVTAALMDEGHRSLAIAASQIINHTPPQGHVSSRHLAAAAGIGWIGRSGLLVTPSYGARVRLVTVLTDAAFEAGETMAFSCGKCAACVKVCPAGAIAAKPEDFHLGACYAKLTEFTRIPFVGQHICGVCVKACAADNAGRAVDADGKPVRD